MSVTFLSELSACNLQTVYGQNLWRINQICSGRLENFRESYRYSLAPKDEEWRIPLVKELLEVKWNTAEIENIGDEPDLVDTVLIDLCSS